MSTLDKDLVLAWSHGAMSRQSIAWKLRRDVAFGELLAAAHDQGLEVPVPPTNPQSPGRRLLAEALARAG